jgi:hypothetical protein
VFESKENILPSFFNSQMPTLCFKKIQLSKNRFIKKERTGFSVCVTGYLKNMPCVLAETHCADRKLFDTRFGEGFTSR